MFVKAWIDRLLVPRRTFAYVDGAPRGLCGGKRVLIASSRGGVYTEGPFAAFDHQETNLRAVFGFIGVTDLTVFRVEGVAIGPEKRDTGIASAEAGIAALAA